MQPLPRDFVDPIFTRLMARYGAAWSRMWRGLDPEALLDSAHGISSAADQAAALTSNG